MTHLLADSSSSALGWSIILIAAVVIGLLVVLRVKKWLLGSDVPERAGFTLSDLRRMHKEGRMTTEEFEKAKMLIIGSVKPPADKPAPPLDPEPRKRPLL